MKGFVLFLILLFSAVAGSATIYQEKAVVDGGIIKGKVVWKSSPPAATSIPVAKDYQQFCGATKSVPAISISKDGGLANAVLFLEGITSGKKKLPPTKVQLDQKNCEYVPRVLVVPPGVEVEILNSDPFLHNVHTYNTSTEKPVTMFNLAFPVQGQKVTRKFTEAGKIISLCDAGHPWMSAHIFVAEHPYYAVTDAEGNFSLDQVPPGTYTLRLWHEGMPKLQNNSNTAFLTTAPLDSRKQVSVPKKGTVTINFEL